MNKDQSKLNRDIGFRIRSQREFLGFTREELSEKADISTQFLADIEVGRKSMTAKTLINLSNALSVPTDYILKGTLEVSTSDHLSAQMHLLFNSLSPYGKREAIEILKHFSRALDHESTKKEEP